MTKKWLVLLLVMLFAFHTMVSAADTAKENKIPKKVLKVLKKAEKALKDKKFDKALEHYNNAVELGPEVSAVYYGIARLNLAQQKNDEAVQNLDKAIGLDKDNLDLKKFYAQTVYKLADQAFKNRNAKKAVEYFSKVVELPGLDKINEKMLWISLYNLGAAHSAQKNLQKANEYFIKLSKYPGLAEADKLLLIDSLYNTGINFYTLKKGKESNEYFLKVLQYPEFESKSKTRHISLHYLIGQNAIQSQDEGTAKEYFGKFLELSKDSPEHAQLQPMANFFMGSILFNDLKKEADKIFATKEKDNVKKVSNLAEGKKEIETYLLKSIQQNPNLEPAYNYLGNYYIYSHKMEKAIEMYQSLIDKFPQSQDFSQYRVTLESLKQQSKVGKKDKKKRKK